MLNLYLFSRNASQWLLLWINACDQEFLLWWSITRKCHFLKSVQILSFFWSVFCRIRTETERYGVSLRIQSECGEIRTRRNSVFRHFPHSVKVSFYFDFLLNCLWIVTNSLDSSSTFCFCWNNAANAPWNCWQNIFALFIVLS